MGASDDPDTRQLIERASGGCQEAREQLLARYRGQLRRMVAMRMDDRLSPRVDPSDVVQEALVDASRRLTEYLQSRPVSFYPWLRQIAFNRLVDLHRAHIRSDKRSVKREQSMPISDASATWLAEGFLARDTGPVRRLLRAELRARVQQILAKLSEYDREIILLRHLEELSSAECAEVLGITEAATKQRHVRAVQRLRALLADETWGAYDGPH